MMSNSGASASSASSAAKMVRFARPLGATVILIGMVLLIVGASHQKRCLSHSLFASSHTHAFG